MISSSVQLILPLFVLPVDFCGLCSKSHALLGFSQGHRVTGKLNPVSMIIFFAKSSCNRINLQIPVNTSVTLLHLAKFAY